MKPHMHLTVQMAAGYGVEPGSWRWPGENPAAFIDVDTFVKAGRIAERGLVDAFFMDDRPGITNDLSGEPPHSGLDPLVVLAAMAAATERVGLVASVSTSVNEPYTIARQLRSLDHLSQGRMGWNVVTTNAPAALQNYLASAPRPEHKHVRAREVWQAVLALWGSWPDDALLLDVAAGRFAAMHRLRPINFRGRHVASRGPLGLPPSPQGMPVVFAPGDGPYGFRFAAPGVEAVYNQPLDLAAARRYWRTLSEALRRQSRAPDEVTVFSSVVTSLASSEREALDRRAALDALGNPQARLRQLAAMLGVEAGQLNPDRPIPVQRLPQRVPASADPRAQRAYALALQGWSLHDILAHGVLGHHPVAIGTPEQVADFLEAWFRADIGGGFTILPDAGLGALTDFVEQVVPILQARGLFRQRYTGQTLRDHLGLPYRNGPVPG
ncbi:NtaA/DmoA family FMN-dependent monooxygenase [Xanthomonas campestris pv. esculenti]|nr:NtaA/DmoA family FMN-dependent monooxygenase [Xanthomonas campestris pv. esculenti]